MFGLCKVEAEHEGGVLWSVNGSVDNPFWQFQGCIENRQRDQAQYHKVKLILPCVAKYQLKNRTRKPGLQDRARPFSKYVRAFRDTFCNSYQHDENKRQWCPDKDNMKHDVKRC